MSTHPPPSKKRKVEQPKNPPKPKFINPDQIRQALQNQNQNTPNAVVEVLNQIRNQFTIRSDEGVISSQDERLAIAQQWLTKNPGAQDLFNLWETSNPRQHNLLVSIISVLAALLPLLSSHYTYHAVGYPIVKTLLTPQWMRKLNSYIGGAHNELILVTLKLLIGISGFAGGKEKKSLLEAFQWETKSLPKLLSLRRRGKIYHDPLAKPDIRSLYILFLLSFLDAPTQTKNTFLEQHRDAFSSIFKGFSQDPYLFIRHVFETLWVHLWSDPKIKRTTKIGIFNETTVSHLLKIYERTGTEDDTTEHIPADLVHHFLLAITSRPGSGICFKERGWYPREDADDNGNTEKSGKLYNKILANILKTLKVNEDSRQQELARRILEACPELVAGYWSSAQLTLEPRLSTKWITNISFFGTIISLPISSTSFFLPNTDNNLYNPIPPPFQTILSNILPSDISPKLIFTKGLQSSSGLVQHCTALALVKCLIKYAKVLEVFKGIEEDLEMGDTEEGLWGKRRREVEKEVRKRVPEFQVIVGFSQQKVQSAQRQPKYNPVRGALLQESAQRLLLLYHMHLPEVVAEARFDVGKALTSFIVPADDEDGDEDGGMKKFNLIQQLHVLRMLKESSNFVWTNKSSNSRTYLYILLKSYTSSHIPALKSTLLDLLAHLLANAVFFQETPTEPNLWLLSLPSLIRVPNATSSGQAKIIDEAESVVTFLEDCIQRCLKTPYRYIDDMQKLLTSHSPSSEELNSDIYPSPLIMTLVEQLEAKLKIGGLLTPLDVLAIVSFLRKLVLRLSSRVRELVFLKAFVGWVGRVIDGEEERGWCLEYPQMKLAIKKEMKMMREIVNPMVSVSSASSPDLEAYLEEVEGLPIAETSHDRMIIAHSIINRLRFTEGVLPASPIKRFILGIQRHWAPALRDLAQYLPPRSGYLWENHVLVGMDIGTPISAVWLFYDATKEQILDQDYRTNFAATFFSSRPSLQSCLELFRLVEHRLRGVDEDETCGLLSLLSVLTREASLVLKDNDMVTLKENLVARPGIVKQLAMTPHLDGRIRVGLRDLMQSSFNPRSVVDRGCLSEISAYWLALLQEQPISDVYDKFDDAAIWVQYLPLDPILQLLDRLTNGDTLLYDSHLNSLLQSILGVIHTAVEDNAVNQNALRERIPQLLKVQKQLSGTGVVEDLLFLAIDSTLPLGYSPHQRLDSEHERPVPLMKLIERAKVRWDRRAQPLGCVIPLDDFLSSNAWTPLIPTIISSLLYKQGCDPRQFEKWLGSKSCSSCSREPLAIIVQAALDIHHCLSPNMDALTARVWMPHFPRIAALCFDSDIDASIRLVSTSCMELALDIFVDHSEELIGLLRKQVDKHRSGRPTLEAVRLGLRPEIAPILQDWVLHWLVDKLSGDMSLSSDTLQLINAAGHLLRSCNTIKGHQVETTLGVIIQHHLSRPSPVGLAIECINRTHLKPVAVNRYIQSILNHPLFYKLSNGNKSEPDPRSHIVDFLHTLFNLHPTNTCQITQIEPLLSIYRGTLSQEDLKLFSIFQLFEVQRKISLAPLFNRWSSSIEVTYSALDALLSLDTVKVFRTTLHFPKWRKLSTNAIHSNSRHDTQLYDPIFLMLLVHLVLSEHQPATPFGWIELFRTNVVGLCIRSLSSKDKLVRELGLSLLASLFKCIEDSEFQEQAHVSYILNLLKDLFSPSSAGEALRRLPSFTTLILAHALRGIFYPSNFVYPLTSRFLLQRPELDANDVPMLYSMLYSNADEWKKDRGWIIRFLADGMMSSDDWRVLKRRHTWDLLASLFQSSNSDQALRRGTFEVIANLTCHRQATMSMIIKSSFLAWLEMQLTQVNDHEDTKWAKTLGNVVLIVDHSKLDSVLKGAWRASICRCFAILLSRSNDGLILPLVAPSIFRLNQSSATLIPEMEKTIVLATQAVVRLEPLHDAAGDSDEAEPIKTSGLYYSYAMDDPVDVSRSYRSWLDCVVPLWRVAMKSSYKLPSWDVLTYQLLASQLYERSKHVEVEWVRREVVRSLQKYPIC